MTPLMTNEELQIAIDAAGVAIDHARDSLLYNRLMDHYSALLQEQLSRSSMMVIKEDLV